MELDKDEMRRLANTVRDNKDAEAEAAAQFQYNDESTIGTTTSTRSKLLSNSNSRVVHCNPNNAIIYPLDNHGDDDQAHAKMKEIIFSPPFRQTLFLGICFVFLGLGILLTMEILFSVETAQDWIEPHRDKYMLYNGGGVD
jgi:hypothetical protein